MGGSCSPFTTLIPIAPAYPSATDVRLATWPDAHYLLVSLMDKAKPDLRGFSIVEEQVTEEPVVVV